MGKIVSIDNFMHKWIGITADKPPEFSKEARYNFEKLIGEDGRIQFKAVVEDVEWLDEEIICIKFIHPYAKGNVKGFRYDLYEMDDKSEELLSTIGHKLKVGDAVILSGEYASCDFGLWFLDSAYQNLPEQDGYYMVTMDILNLQLVEKQGSSEGKTKVSTIENTTEKAKIKQNFGIGKYIAAAVIGGLLYSCVFGNEEKEPNKSQMQIESTVANQESTTEQESIVAKEITPETEQVVEIRMNPYEEYKDYPIYSEQFVHYYVNSGILDTLGVCDGIEELHADLSKATVGQAYVEPKGIFSEKGFKNEGYETDYIYEGEMKDGQPHGVGTVYYRTYTRLTDIFFKVYTGYFDEGEFTKFGISYDLAYLDCSQGGVSNIIEEEYNAEYQYYLGLYYNPIQYIGQYKNGERNGIGVELIYPKDEYKDYISNKYTIDDVQVMSGTYKNNDITEGKMYVHEYLLYEGEFKDSLKHGIGQLYYRNTNALAFSGRFKDDEVVEGTLVDPEGNLICEGEWIDGYCGIIDFYDEYYKYSNIEARDVGEELGEDYGSEEDWQRLYDLINGETSSQDGLDSVATEYLDEYILPESSTRYLIYDDLYGLSKETLRLARNEIFAKHGRKFETADLNEYFTSKSWYNGYLSQEEFDESVLNQFEKANLDLIKSVESGMAVSQEYSALKGGIYESEGIRMDYTEYSSPFTEGNVTNLGDLEIMWPNGMIEWANVLEGLRTNLVIMDMYGEIIGELLEVADQQIKVQLYGEDYQFVCIELHQGN